MVAGEPFGQWVDKLAIRELIERSVRCIDDRDGRRLAELFAEDGVLQLAGTVFAGREALERMFEPGAVLPQWTASGNLLRQPASTHLTSNPVIDVDGDRAAAETDMVTLVRGADGKAKITLLARYRDRVRRTSDGSWVITNRTGVSIARPGDEGTDREWLAALAAMPPETRAVFRTDG